MLKLWITGIVGPLEGEKVDSKELWVRYREYCSMVVKCMDLKGAVSSSRVSFLDLPGRWCFAYDKGC